MQPNNPKVIKKILKYNVFDCLIGTGSSGKVYLGSNTETRQLVAIKVYDKGGLQSAHKIVREQMTKNISRESHIHKQLSHEHIVKLFDVCESKSSIYFIMEYCQFTLEQYLKSQQSQLAETKVRDLFSQICQAFIYLRNVEINVEQCEDLDVTFGQEIRPGTRQGLCHRDLKPSNILILNDQIKLCDFGLTRDLNVSNQTIGLGTPVKTNLYMAPTSLQGKESAEPEKVDVWSAGIILYEMLFKQHPWKPTVSTNFTMQQLIHNMQTQQLVIPEFPKYSAHLKDLLQHMLAIEEPNRFNWNQVASHSWINLPIVDDTSMQSLSDNIHSLTIGDEKNPKILQMHDIRAVQQFYKDLFRELESSHSVEFKILQAFVATRLVEEHFRLLAMYELEMFQHLNFYNNKQRHLINSMLAQSSICSKGLQEKIDQIILELKTHFQGACFDIQFHEVQHVISIFIKSIRPNSKCKSKLFERLRFLQRNFDRMNVLTYSEVSSILDHSPPNIKAL